MHDRRRRNNARYRHASAAHQAVAVRGVSMLGMNQQCGRVGSDVDVDTSTLHVTSTCAWAVYSIYDAYDKAPPGGGMSLSPLIFVA